MGMSLSQPTTTTMMSGNNRDNIVFNVLSYMCESQCLWRAIYPAHDPARRRFKKLMNLTQTSQRSSSTGGWGTLPQNFHLMSGVGIYPTLLVTTITIAASSAWTRRTGGNCLLNR